MTKEQRAERKDLHRRLKNVRGNRGRVQMRVLRDKRTLEKAHRKAVAALNRDLQKQQNALEKELRLERRIADTEELAILNRLAAVEGRLAS
jgi:hypothetical protein